MNDVGPLAGLEHELQGRFGKKGHAPIFIGKAVISPTIEKVVGRMSIDKETLPAVHKAKPDSAMYRSVVPWYP